MSPDPAFGKLEFRLLRCRKALGLEHQHVAFLCLLRAFDYNAKGYSFRGQETYAVLLGVSIKTIERWTAMLESRKLIEVKRRRGPNGKRRPNEISWRGLERRLNSLEPPDTAVSAGSVDQPTQPCLPDHPTQLCPEPPDTAVSAEGEEVEAEEPQVEEAHTPRVRDLLGQILEEFNRTAQSSYAAPKWLAMIEARCREHPDLGLAEHAAVIGRSFAAPWWGEGVAGSPSVLYKDAAVFEKAMHATGRPRLSKQEQRNADRKARWEDAFGPLPSPDVVEGTAVEVGAVVEGDVVEGAAVEVPNGDGEVDLDSLSRVAPPGLGALSPYHVALYAWRARNGVLQ